MRSKVAVIVSLVFVLAVGGAALAVNTRILNTSPPARHRAGQRGVGPRRCAAGHGAGPADGLAFGPDAGDADRAATHRGTAQR